MNSFELLQKLCRLLRYDILTSTTNAGSGHPTTSLSAVELMATLFFDGFLHYDLKNPHYVLNDRVIFSKGHAAPLLYSLYHAGGVISYEKLMTLRKFNSVIEGHPSPRWPYVDVASGSLGQGLSVGIGMALGIKLRIKNLEFRVNSSTTGGTTGRAPDSAQRSEHWREGNPGQNLSREPKVYVLLGDSETAEGQIWEALQLASFYKLNNLIGILDVNRLGQRGETMLGWDIKTYEKRIASFGWKTIVVDDGHDLNKVNNAFKRTNVQTLERPTMIIAKTVKGKGVSFLENKDGWHGKPVPKEMLESALKELGKTDLNVRGKIVSPKFQISNLKFKIKSKTQISNDNMLHVTSYKLHDLVSTREAYGDALVLLGKNENVVVLDAETSNSTYAEKFKKVNPDWFFEMFIAEQNMVSVALGISKIGYIPYVSSFAAFLTRAFDQMRITQYSHPNVKITGSHAGVSIGEDGPSQMALEDIAMARSLLESVVLYPSDATSTIKLVEQMYNQKGMIFLRTTREKTPVIYENNEQFRIGGSKIHQSPITNHQPQALIIAAGITLHEALKAQRQLAKEKIGTVVMDCYSIKPIDVQSINRLVTRIKNIIVVEDHYPYGGLGEAVMQALLVNLKFQISNLKFAHLCVRKISPSGKPSELLRYEGIDAEAIITKVESL